jgi:hypothetical protein
LPALKLAEDVSISVGQNAKPAAGLRVDYRVPLGRSLPAVGTVKENPHGEVF